MMPDWLIALIESGLLAIPMTALFTWIFTLLFLRLSGN